MTRSSAGRLAVAAIAAALAAALAVATLAPAATAQGEQPGHRTAARPAPMQRLHATTGQHAAIRNERGAQVLLRGVNVNGLVEYYQPNPAYPTVVPQTRDDFRRIARLGFNTVRLLVSWSRLEPTPGAYDRAYVTQVRRAVGWARDFHLYVVLDMHQDAYGVAVDTPAGTTCSGSTRPSNGWDGAPAWATITDGQTTCGIGERELAPAVQRAWDHFYADTDGVQTHLVRTWGRLARDFARSSTVAGFDLLNEPGFGSAMARNASRDLGHFYDRTIRSIRRGERAGGGFSHIVFFEPSVMWSALGSFTTPPRRFTRDRNIVFAPHIYAESLSPNTIRAGFTAARFAAQSYGTTVWSGEWGFFPEHPADAAAQVRRYAAAEDRYGYGGAWWVWEQACGNPHMVGAPGGTPAPVSPSLVRFACPSGASLGIDPAFGDVLSRPTVRAVPGRITTLTSDGSTGALLLEGRHTDGAARCALRVHVPARFAAARVRTSGITHLQRHRSHGNVVLRGCVADSFRLRVG